MSAEKYCFIIPNYNHVQALPSLLERLSHYELPVIMVNDGSQPELARQMQTVTDEYERVTLLHHSQNQGKGGAVQTGLRYALEQGFSHGLQVDADGQHCLDDIDTMLALSKQSPETLISGRPVYDASIPKHRFISRYITHFWVCVETLSHRLEDTMCGFRVYPLAPVTELMNNVRLGRGMDFDIEILVRLDWRGVPMQFVPTAVIYPQGGSSHFRLVKDNVLISWMHTRLFFGMLWRSPKLIWRHISEVLL
ncbi:glycosyltransferase family 2 protein [Lacimicrobium sp. SS2-24]|uniref:glycosyltransferase family 2 protein n=1 Tax=Lacimicrobium sp. SS2-24 TaxID=2005569 RepID=UPI000B4AB75D|nr:glycosyltransferase family 2 protein [Lacimicrobium sp. SS2-24]